MHSFLIVRLGRTHGVHRIIRKGPSSCCARRSRTIKKLCIEEGVVWMIQSTEGVFPGCLNMAGHFPRRFITIQVTCEIPAALKPSSA